MPAAKNSISAGLYKTPPFKRFSAGFLDLLIAAVPALGLIWFGLTYRVLGALATLLILLLKDHLPTKSAMPSPGKKAFGLRVEPSKGKRERITTLESALRNIPLATGPAILAIPIASAYVTTLGLLFWAFANMLESLIIIRDPEGRRLGDQMAGTKVFD